MFVRRNIRLSDIARATGYSINTVSRALRDKDDIGEKTKRKIKETASSMGYLPNSIAASLRSGITHNVAIIFDNMINPYFMIMADKIHYILDQAGYATMIFAVYNSKFLAPALNPIISRKIDAIITFLEPEEKVVELCKENQIPLLLIGRENPNLAIDAVFTNDFLGGYKVGEHFSQIGAKRVGYLGAPETIECSVRRHNGLKQALLDNALDYYPENLRYMSSLSMEEEIETLIMNKVDAIFFFNDMLALEGIKILQKFNRQVPEDLKVVGYDNIGSDFILPINITSVDSNKDEIAQKAVETILNKMNGKDNLESYNSFEYPINLKIGTTT